MLFVDSGAWFAMSVPSDPDHAVAAAIMMSNRERLVTTDFIYDEVVTVFRRRRQIDRARDWVNQIVAGECELAWVGEADVTAATEVFFQFRDKGWSFTDCTSGVVMERLGIVRAFSFDHHFRQFGTVTVVP